MEIWKDIKGYEGLYQVSNLGNIKSLKRNTTHERILVPRVGRDGYKYVGLCKDGIIKTKKIHRLVAETFIPNPTNLSQINHKDGNKINNLLENLEWCNASYNQKHAIKLGLVSHWMKGKTGKDCPFSKKVDQYTLNNIFIKTWDSMSDVKRELGLPVSNISLVCQGKKKTYGGFIWKYHKEGDANWDVYY